MPRHPQPSARLSAAAATIAAAALSSLPAWTGVARADEQPLVFAQPFYDEFPAPFFPTMLVARDLDGDGVADLVVPGRDPEKRLFTMKGVGNGRFTVLESLAADGFVDWVDLADLDGDGTDDLVAAWRGDFPRLVVHRGLPGGLFGEPEVLAGVVDAIGRDPQGLAVADFDGDGDADIAVAQYVSSAVEVFTNLGRGGDGALSFERSARVRVGSFLGGYAFPRVVAAGDLDGDGDIDLVVNEIGGSRIAVMRNESGRFARAVEYRAPQIGNERPGIAGMRLIDFDGDGDLDALCPALLIESQQKILAFVNDGNGGLSERLVGSSAPLGYAFSLELADLDGDGDLDAATGAALPGLIQVGRRTAAGVFDLANDSLLPFGQLIRHLVAVDVDGDCDLDLVGVDGPARVVLTAINQTPGASGACGGGVAAAERGDGGTRAPEPPPEALPLPAFGDMNDDGARDAADLALWLATRSQALVPKFPGAVRSEATASRDASSSRAGRTTASTTDGASAGDPPAKPADSAASPARAAKGGAR